MCEEGRARRLKHVQTREKRQNKMELSGLSEAELLRQQEELFRNASAKFNEAPQ